MSIVAVAAGVTVLLLLMLTSSRGRFGWAGEPFVWLYVLMLWAGGLKVLLGSRRPVAEADETLLVLRPLHQLRSRSIAWETIRGTEQMIGGDRLIIYFDAPRGPRMVALNLNLVRGRREFLALVEERLRAQGFVEKVVERSRYLSRRTGE